MLSLIPNKKSDNLQPCLFKMHFESKFFPIKKERLATLYFQFPFTSPNQLVKWQVGFEFCLGKSSFVTGCSANLWEQFSTCLQKPMLERMPVARIDACRTQEIANVDFSVHTQVNKIILPIPAPSPRCEKKYQLY
jgi:hypothetical protein